MSSTTIGVTSQLADGTPVASEAEAASVEAYWTPERMANAIPVEAPPSEGQPPPGPDEPAGQPGEAPPAAPEQPPVRDGSLAVDRAATAGKVFFRKPTNGRDYVCSASAINSPSKQMVITAGHCVNTGGNGSTAGKWMTNWTYVPAYHKGSRPYGTFSAKQFRTFKGWIDDSNWDWDVAMVTLLPRAGKKIVNVTGGHGLAWNHGRSEARTIFGYPGNHDKGEVQWYCKGTTRRVAWNDGKVEIQCNFGGGSSGGPWLHGYNNSTQLGHVNGVTSTITKTGGWNASSYFGDSVKAMFDAQGSKT
ncbi:trypsin-like serine peptidase [Streptomyces sp. NPDC017979]|uniref:trypsin-like serine peptidase n=1 Tax=Streptomyces sp. NPDC017979 TaxID=3365024 RepID=UPI003790712C